MKKENLIYYLLIWIVMTAAYSVAVLLYFNLKLSEIYPDIAVFSIVILGTGFSLWFVIRYMDVGTHSFAELTISHLAAATVFSLLVTFIVNWLLFSLLHILPEGLRQILVIAKLFIVYFLYAMMLLNYYILKYRDNLIRKEQSEEKLKNLLQEAELNLLKSQLNPHFIFNSLNSINSLSVTDPSKARDMVVKLSTFLRYSLGKHADEMVQVSEELESVRLFIDIEKTRFGKRLNVEEKIDPNCLKRNIPLMILQPLLENAIKFGVYEQLGDVKIKLEVNELENGFEVVIENNYDPGETDSKGKGIGLRNVQKRLEILYGKNHGFYVESKDNIFRVRIIFKEK